MRISDWSSDVCSSDLRRSRGEGEANDEECGAEPRGDASGIRGRLALRVGQPGAADPRAGRNDRPLPEDVRSLLGAGADRGMGMRPDRKSGVDGKSGSVRVDLGGRRILNKKK